MKKLVCALAVVCSSAFSLAATPEVKFDVMEFVVEGNTVLPANVVEQVLAPFMGPARSFKDIDAAREALEKAFQDAGYLSVVVSLPNQRVENGEVRLDVTEAKVERLAVTGAQYHLPSKLKAQVPSLAVGQTPYFPLVQQELAAVQAADMQVTPLIGAGDEPSAIQVELKVQDQPAVQGSVEINNNQSANTTKGRVSAAASYANLFQLGHRIGLSWQYAPWRPADGNTLSALYGVPLTRRDDLTFSLTQSRSDTPVATGEGGSTLTRGDFYGLRWTRDLDALAWPVRHGLFASVDYKNNKDRTDIVDTLSTEKPPLRYTVLSGGYNLSWNAPGERQVGFETSVATSTHSISGRQVDCDGVQMDQFACKRSGASPDFAAWRLGLNYKGPLWAGWRVSLSGEAQVASGPLASGEQYSLGGKESVRGYYDYEQAGDWGWLLRAEASSPPWFDLGGWKALGLAFYDRGTVGLIDPLEGQRGHSNLASAGLGWRLENGKGLVLAIDVARPIYESQRAADSGGYEIATRRHSTHVHASLKQSF
jgi:hemolysin activation/secretion protein